MEWGWMFTNIINAHTIHQRSSTKRNLSIHFQDFGTRYLLTKIHALKKNGWILRWCFLHLRNIASSYQRTSLQFKTFFFMATRNPWKKIFISSAYLGFRLHIHPSPHNPYRLEAFRLNAVAARVAMTITEGQGVLSINIFNLARVFSGVAYSI